MSRLEKTDITTFRDRTGDRLVLHNDHDGAPILEVVPRGEQFGPAVEITQVDLPKLIAALERCLPC